MDKRAIDEPRVYPVDELDGFYVDGELDRTVHITFDAEDVIVVDVFDTTAAAYAPVGEPLSIVEINLRTGSVTVVEQNNVRQGLQVPK